MTDAELDAALLAKRAREAQPQAPQGDMSDEQLDEMLRQKRAQQVRAEADARPITEIRANQDAPVKAGLLSAVDSAMYGNFPRVQAGLLSLHPDINYEDAYKNEVADFKNLQESNPRAAMAGDIAGAMLGPDPFSKIKGAAVLGQMGYKGANWMAKSAGAVAAAGTRGGLSATITDDKDNDSDKLGAIARGGLLSGAIDAGAQTLGMAGRASKAATSTLTDIFNQKNLKRSAPMVEEASQRLGITPMRGMLEDNERLHKYESQLLQAPTKAGEIMKDERRKIYDTLEERSRGHLPEIGLSGEDAGRKIKDGLLGKNEPRFLEAQAIYQDFDKAYGKLPVSDKQKKYLESEFSKDLLYRSGKSGVGNTISGMLPEIKTVSDLQKARTYFLAQVRDKQLPAGEKQLAKEALNYFDRAVNNSIQRAAKETGGKDASKLAMKGLGKARSLYRQTAEDLSGLSNLSGKKGKTLPDIIGNLEEMEPAVLTKALNLRSEDNINALRQFAGKYPEEIKTVSQKIMTDIQNKVEKDGKVDVKAFVREFDKIPENVRSIYFGKSFNSDLKDLKTVTQSMKEKVLGPSGTPEGQAYQGFLSNLSLKGLLSEARDRTLYDNYKSKGGGLLGKAAKGADDIANKASKSKVVEEFAKKTRSALEKKTAEKMNE